MRKFLLLPFLLAACATERPADDTTAAAPATAAPAATLTAADLSGTWRGMSYAAGSDTATGRWTVTSLDDTSSQIVYEGAEQPIRFSTTFDADSMIAVSEPYPDPERNGMMVRFRSVGRLQGDRLAGTSELRAAEGDSVLQTGRWEATRVQP